MNTYPGRDIPVVWEMWIGSLRKWNTASPLFFTSYLHVHLFQFSAVHIWVKPTDSCVDSLIFSYYQGYCWGWVPALWIHCCQQPFCLFSYFSFRLIEQRETEREIEREGGTCKPTSLLLNCRLLQIGRGNQIRVLNIICAQPAPPLLFFFQKSRAKKILTQPIFTHNLIVLALEVYITTYEFLSQWAGLFLSYVGALGGGGDSKQ